MKTITVEVFDEAVSEVAARITMEHPDKLKGTLMFIASGMAFAVELRKELFGKEDEE